MKVVLEKVRREFHRDVYWTKLHLISDDGTEETLVIMCASFEYLSQYFKKHKFTDFELEEWSASVSEKWKNQTGNIFSKNEYFDIYTTTEEGYTSTLLFLEEEVSKKQ